MSFDKAYQGYDWQDIKRYNKGAKIPSFKKTQTEYDAKIATGDTEWLLQQAREMYGGSGSNQVADHRHTAGQSQRAPLSDSLRELHEKMNEAKIGHLEAQRDKLLEDREKQRLKKIKEQSYKQITHSKSWMPTKNTLKQNLSDNPTGKGAFESTTNEYNDAKGAYYQNQWQDHQTGN
jgi:hypothetical protein